MKYLAALITAWLLVACGGGGGGSAVQIPVQLPTQAQTPAPATTVTCQPFLDNFGRQVSCAEMNALAGAALPYIDSGAGSGDGAGDGGADGSAGDGAPIANTSLTFTDANNKVVTTSTDANGYFRISLRGLKAPLVASVIRNGKPWKSMLVDDIVRAPANRKFYTINLTGLTDVVASKISNAEGLSNIDSLTSQAVSHQKAQVPAIIGAVNSSIASQITAAGLNPNGFNPLTTPFQAVSTDSSDKLLESLVFLRDVAIGTGAESRNTATAQLYVSLFGRAPDANGLAFWAAKFSPSQPIEKITELMIADPAFSAYYPSPIDYANFVNHVYVNTFGRGGDPAGMAYWTATLKSGVSPGTMIVSFVLGARGVDRDFFNNRVEVAQYYGEHHGSVASAIVALDGVTDDPATVVAAKARIDKGLP